MASQAIYTEAQKAAGERERERVRKREQIKRAACRDLGPTPEIEDIDRRESCRFDFAKFCKTYNESAFYLPWSPIHYHAIERIEETVLHGALYAYAMPRGSGKSTLAKMAAWWALSYAHRRYVFLIGATGDRSSRLLESIKVWLRFNQPYIHDFPEISIAIRDLNGRGNGASGQTQNGEATMIGWTKDAIVMPTVEPPPNFDYGSYGLDSMPSFAVTSGSMVGCTGLTGDGLRGSVVTTAEGEELRPDLVLPDDPQTDQSAKSPTQNQDRYDLMTGTVLGMAGPDKSISLLMPCTIIRNGDMVSQILDRKKNPLFRGTTTSILTSMPNNMPLWEEYFEQYYYGMLQEPPTFEFANKFYTDNRDAMDDGAEATWPERKLDEEISGIQHAMNLFARDRKTFWSEFMNQPLEMSGDIVFLSPDDICAKQHNYGRLECPIEVSKVTAFIDVQQEMLIYTVIGFSDQYDGFILDYGTYPDQPSRFWEKRNSAALLTNKFPKMTEDGRIYSALCEFRDILLTTRIVKPDDGTVLNISMVGVDRGYKPQTVLRFVRDSRDRRIVPVRGGVYTGKEKPMNHPDYLKKWTSGGRRLGPHWRLGDAQGGVQSIETNPNFWKTFVHERLATPIGDPGSLSLYKQKPFAHQLFAAHLTSEYRVAIESKYGKFDVWSVKPGKPDNDYLDAVAGACMLGSFVGIKAIGAEEDVSPVKRRKVNASSWGSVRK